MKYPRMKLKALKDLVIEPVNINNRKRKKTKTETEASKRRKKGTGLDLGPELDGLGCPRD